MNCARSIWYPHSKQFGVDNTAIDQSKVSFVVERALLQQWQNYACIVPDSTWFSRLVVRTTKLVTEVDCCSCRTVAGVFTFTRQDRSSWMAHCIQLIFWCVRILVWQTYLNQGKNTLVRKPCVHYWKKCRGWLVTSSNNRQIFLALILMCPHGCVTNLPLPRQKHSGKVRKSRVHY